ncbi:RNA polymerase sigma factor [Parapedobacter pyrenivorans]|uniref:RNA polymerase sigma factor n=1 Tax=Parapedobacter pyrenivorans TaxID=1305674 RepID=UPI00333F7214
MTMNTDHRPDLLSLYQRMFPAVARHVSKWGGNVEEAKDIFHDALIVYYEKATLGTMVYCRNDEAYVFGVARHLWTKRYVQNQRHASLDQLMAGYEVADTGMDWPSDAVEEEITATAGKQIMQVLHAAGQKCMELLTAFYYEGFDMQELAQRFGFSGTRSATVQKFKCLQKVKKVVKEKALQYEDFVG